MIISKVLSSYVFRYGMLAVLFSAISTMALMFIFYSVFSYNNFKDVDQGFADELSKLIAVHQNSGVDAVDSFITQSTTESTTQPATQLIDIQYDYIIVDEAGRKLAGNLKHWPKFAEYNDWFSFELAQLHGENDIRLMGKRVILAEGHQLLVARNSITVPSYSRFFAIILISSFIITVFMGSFAAFFMTWDFQRHVNRINQSIKAIMDGNLSERLIISKSGSKSSGDLQQLALHLNMMLDRIQYLMDGVKQVSDNIAHDLRTPLTRMRNNLVTFEKNCNQNDLSIVQQLIVEADNMLGTFNALQRIARVELGDSSIEKAQLKLHQLLGDVIELYEPVASEKSITFEVSIVDVDIVADRNLLFQAFANLLDNAIKYTPENGHVVITLSTKDDYQLLTPKQAAFKPQAILTVADNGCGIAKQNYSKVFRRFYREEGSRGKQPGNGLGLSLVAAVAKVHSSQVILKPNDPGLRVHMVFS